MKLWLCLCVSLALFGCETHQMYYGSTSTTISSDEIHYRIDLSDSSLTQIPAHLLYQTELRTLNLSGNPDLNLTQALEIVCKLPKLRILLLNKLQMKTLPQSIEECSLLQQISLTHNPSLDFAQAFSSLRSLPLNFIDLSHNQLSKLPASIAQLSRLQDLRLSHNIIRDAQSYMYLSQLPDLFSLWLDNNQLKKVPSSIASLKSVNYLFLDNNMLNDLPRQISKMENLSSLSLAFNCFTQLPPILAKTQVYMLFINNNLLTDIGEPFASGTFYIQGISLDNNFLGDKQKKRAAEIFFDTFIYSDNGQKNNDVLAYQGHCK